jgi:hypothetical protein
VFEQFDRARRTIGRGSVRQGFIFGPRHILKDYDEAVIRDVKYGRRRSSAQAIPHTFVMISLNVH